MRKMSILGCALLLLAGLAPDGRAGVDYRIEAAFDPQSKLIDGKAVLSWTNQTQHPAQDLQFHLYFNAWKDKDSSFQRSFRRRDRDLSELVEADWGFTEIKSLVVVTQLPSPDPQVPSQKHDDYTEKLRFIQPDDGNASDRTVLQVPLQQPVAAGETVQVEIEFRTKVPRTFARTGFRGDYVLLAHWFPKLGVFEEEGAWNCHQFIQTEFYSQFGDYDVKLRLPSDWVLGATGQLQERKDNGDGSATHHYMQQRVHGFAWVASPHLQVHTRRFEHPGLPAAQMRLLLMPDHSGQRERYFAATEAALRHYGEWFGAYPYGHVTVIDPAFQSGTGGMEYPTLFTGGTRWLQPQGSGSPEGVTIHEMGHQFWYGLVANNEFEDAWLDEGFNTYSTRRTMLAAFPDTFIVERYLDGFLPLLFDSLPRAPRSVAGLGSRDDPDLERDIMSVPSWQQGPGAYGVNSYTKPGMMLVTLERYLGWGTFQKVISTFFERWKFRHPRPEDFFEVANEFSGEDLGWFWQETYYSSNLFDYGVESVHSTESEQSLMVRRWGEGKFPIRKIRITFEDGQAVEESWDGQGRWKEFTYHRAEKIQSVEVDPDEVLALDVRRTNNSWQRQAPSSFAARKWSLKWMLWLQNWMEQVAFHF